MTAMKPGMSLLEWRGEHDFVDEARVTLFKERHERMERGRAEMAEAPPACEI